MLTLKSVRVLIDPPAPGAWNMAVDEVLLESALHAGRTSIRCYRWSQPTLSLGYFQSWDPAAHRESWRSLPVVRRLSGGGAILHDDEVTYSLAIPPGHPRTANPHAIYAAVHQVWIDLLKRQGVELQLRGTSHGDRESEFLCFVRGDPNDVVFGEHKVLGSAQRRRRGAILQHGSFILGSSPFAPEIPGLADLTGRAWDAAGLAEDVGERIARELFGEGERTSLDADELRRAAEIVEASVDA